MEQLDHKLDTLGSSVLSTVRSRNGLQDAVIAGGYVRDMIHRKPFKDIDIFIPKTSIPNARAAVGNLPSDYKVSKSSTENFGSHPEYSMNFGVWDVSYLDTVNIQIILTNFPKKDFIPRLIDSFDFTICQVYGDLEGVYATEGFSTDWRCTTATLRNLHSISDLPKHMKRFFRFQEKYPGLVFRCPNLEIKEKEEKLEPLTHLTPAQPQEFLTAHDVLNTLMSFDEKTAMYLNYTVDDITNPETGYILWSVIEKMNGHCEETSVHANELIEIHDAIHGDIDHDEFFGDDEDSPEEPNQIPEGYAEG